MNIDTIKLRSKVSSTRSSAKRRGIAFSLSQKDVLKLYKQSNVCYYFGTMLKEDDITFDRLDCNGPYSISNVVLCSKRANDLKNQLFENTDTMVDRDSLRLFLTRCGFSL